MSATPTKNTSDYRIYFDGGRKGTGETYGSYDIEAGDRYRGNHWLDFGPGTNNEAEYRAMIAGLKDLVETIEKAGKPLIDYTLVIHGDSKLVLKQTEGKWHCRHEHLRGLRDEARSYVCQFRKCTFIRVPREVCVERFGH